MTDNGLNDVQQTILNAIGDYYNESKDAAPLASVFKKTVLTYPNASIQDIGDEFGALARTGAIWRPKPQYVARCNVPEDREQVETVSGPGDTVSREMVGVER